MHSEIITEKDNELIDTLDYPETEFSVLKNDFSKIQIKNEVFINAFCYGNKLAYPIHISDQKFENSMNLLLVFDCGKSHYVCIQVFERYMFSITKKNKKYSFRYCSHGFSSRNVLTEHKEFCLKTNGEQAAKLKDSFLEFKNYFNQIPAPFKIHADFEFIFKNVESNAGSCTKNIKITLLVVFLTKLIMLVINLVNQLLSIDVKMLLINLLKQFLKSLIIVNK